MGILIWPSGSPSLTARSTVGAVVGGSVSVVTVSVDGGADEVDDPMVALSPPP